MNKDSVKKLTDEQLRRDWHRSVISLTWPVGLVQRWSSVDRTATSQSAQGG